MIETAPRYRYRLASTGHSSAKFGPCEVCGQHASEVCIQTEEKAFQPLVEGDPPEVWEKCPDGIAWSHNGTLFGHEACLVAARKEVDASC